jgi:hypothetical protein
MAAERTPDLRVQDAGQDLERTIVIRDRRKPNQYTTDNVIAREWLPILRVGDAFFFYSVYLSMANRETESSWGSLRTQAEYLQCGVDLIIRGNKLLEFCELLYIDSGDQRTTNEYYILDPPSLTDDLKQRIYARLDEIEAQETGKNWQSWVKQVRKALDRHRSLPSIWAERRAKKGGRPPKTVRSQMGAGESQASLWTNSDSEPQPGYMWDTSRVVVSHKQGVREPQTEQEQITKTTKRLKDEELLVRHRCAFLDLAPGLLDNWLALYGLSTVRDQLDWLPCRNPRDPAAMLTSAIQGRWERPAQYDRKYAAEVWKTWQEEAQQERRDALVRGAPLTPDEPAGILRDELPVQGPGDEGNGSAPEECETDVVPSPSGAMSWLLPGTSLDARTVWANVLEELRLQMTRSTFDTWLRGSQVGHVEGGALTVWVRDEYAAEWLRTRLYVPIERTVAGIAGQPVAVQFEPRA